jgi:hypothetical protein
VNVTDRGRQRRARHKEARAMDIQTVYLDDILRTYRNYKALGEGAFAQVSDADLHTLVDPDANSIAVIARHVSGNLRSRFTDFLTTDGDKPGRNRDAEFETPPDGTRAAILDDWHGAWTVVLASIQALTPDDLTRTVHIRGEAFHVIEALNRSATHTAYHVGQMVLLAKHFTGPHWRSLSIPKGKSGDFAVGRFKAGITPPR